MTETPPDDDRISLHGHDPETVLRALLKVDPGSEPVEQDAGAHKAEKPSKGGSKAV
jgi:hypothetical protein